MVAGERIDDGTLLRLWQGGDAAAGERLFERHFEAVARFFRNKSDGSIDDLVQKTFLGCLEGRDRVRGDVGFRPYLFGVARNVLGKHWRTKATRPRAEDTDIEAESIVDLGASPTSVYARDRDQLRMLNALRRIPLGSQVVLELCYWESMTAADIAGVLQIPLGTAKTRIRRARQLLADRLADIQAHRMPIETTATRLATWARGVRPTPRDPES